MAGNLSNYLENKILDHFLGTTSYTMPSTVYLALYTVAPTDAGGGTEVTGGSYARKPITFLSSSGGTTSNDSNVDFTGMPACTVVAVGVFDALTSGNLLVYGDLAVNKTLDAGDIFRAQTGDIIVSID
jgi:hypothetical protein